MKSYELQVYLTNNPHILLYYTLPSYPDTLIKNIIRDGVTLKKDGKYIIYPPYRIKELVVIESENNSTDTEELTSTE